MYSAGVSPCQGVSDTQWLHLDAFTLIVLLTRYADAICAGQSCAQRRQARTAGGECRDHLSLELHMSTTLAGAM